MANKITAIKIKIKDNVATAKVAFSHPMTTYNQAQQKTGNRDDANFITHITAKIGNEVIWDVSTSQFFSKNPIFKFEFRCDKFKIGRKLTGRELDNGATRKPTEIGDMLVIEATDRKGATYKDEAELASRKKNK